MLGKETNEMYTLNIKPVYEEFFGASKMGIIDKMGEPGTLPFVCCCPGDLSYHWKPTKIGHGAKACTCSCMNCALTSENIAAPAEVTCKEYKEKKGPDAEFGQKWKEEHGKDWMCYHHEFADSEFVAKCQATMEELIVEHKVELENLKKSKLKMVTDVNNQLEASADKHSIEFLPVTLKEADAFSELLLNECILRGIDIFNVAEEDRRDELRKHLAIENKIRIFQDNIAHLGDKAGSLYTSL
jgi:hypothetical protein